MPRVPRADEERNFAPSFLGIPSVDVHHDAGVVVDGVRHASVPEERGDQLRKQSGLGETHAHSHRASIIGRGESVSAD
jgi:hypothetical protein